MYAAISRADPQQTAATENKIKKIFQKNRRKAQKEHRKPIRTAKMYKKIIMQKNMQKINLCRPGTQLHVDMP